MDIAGARKPRKPGRVLWIDQWDKAPLGRETVLLSSCVFFYSLTRDRGQLKTMISMVEYTYRWGISVLQRIGDFQKWA